MRNPSSQPSKQPMNRPSSQVGNHQVNLFQDIKVTTL
jgi:hypothetical protein